MKISQCIYPGTSLAKSQLLSYILVMCICCKRQLLAGGLKTSMNFPVLGKKNSLAGVCSFWRTKDVRDSIVVGLGNVTKNNDQEDWCWWGRVGSLSSLQAGGDQGSGAGANLVLSASSSGLVRCVEVTLCYKKIWNVSLKITCICIIFCIMIHHILTLYVIFLGGTGLFRFRFM